MADIEKQDPEWGNTDSSDTDAESGMSPTSEYN